jgi:hypothetical protein
MGNDLKIPLVIFLSSCATLAYEVLLIRLFSISLWYHYAFMIISIAMLGFAASGVLLAIRPPDKPDQERIPIYALLLAVPFFCCGLIIATDFSAQSGRSGLLYGADLIGAGLGSLGILLLLGFSAPERTVFLLAAAAALAPLCAGGNRVRLLALLLIAANLALFAGQPRFASLRVSPYKGQPAALRYPGSHHLKSYYSPFAVIDSFSGQAARFALLRKPLVCAAIALLILIYGLLPQTSSALLAPFGLGRKMALIITLFFPLGLLMGTPFPSDLRLLGEENAP